MLGTASQKKIAEAIIDWGSAVVQFSTAIYYAEEGEQMVIDIIRLGNRISEI